MVKRKKFTNKQIKFIVLFTCNYLLFARVCKPVLYVHKSNPKKREKIHTNNVAIILNCFLNNEKKKKALNRSFMERS